MKTVWILIIGIALFLLFLPKCYCDGCYIDIGGHVLYSIRWDIETYPATSAFPRIAIDSEDNVHIAWLDNRGEGDYDYTLTSIWRVYYSKLDNNGNLIISNKKLTNPKHNPKIMAYQIENELKQISKKRGNQTIVIDSNNNVHIVWESNNNIYYKKIDSDENILIKDTMISPPDYFVSSNPKIDIDSHDNVHVVWMDQRDYPNNQGGDPARYNEGFYEIYYKKLDNNGNAIINDKRLTPTNDIVNIEFD